MEAGEMKNEVGVYSGFIKEEVDLIYESTRMISYDRDNITDCPDEAVNQKTFKVEIDDTGDSSEASGAEFKINVFGDEDAKYFQVKQELDDDSDYVVDCSEVGVLPDADLIGIKDIRGGDFNTCISDDSLLVSRELDKSRFHCEHCNLSTRFIANLRRHIERKHFPELKVKRKKFKYFCTICPHRSRWPYDLRKHMLRHEGKHLFNCHFCSYGVNKKNRIVYHIIEKHVFDSFEEGSFKNTKKCYYCNFKSKVKADFLSHVSDYHRVIYKAQKIRESRGNFLCGLCEYTCDSTPRLVQHIDRVHKKIKPYPCHLCSFATVKSSELHKHISAKHDRITPYKCDVCHYSSAYKTHLRRHIVTQHIYKKPRKPHTRRKLTAPVKTESVDCYVSTSTCN